MLLNAKLTHSFRLWSSSTCPHSLLLCSLCAFCHEVQVRLFPGRLMRNYSLLISRPVYSQWHLQKCPLSFVWLSPSDDWGCLLHCETLAGDVQQTRCIILSKNLQMFSAHAAMALMLSQVVPAAEPSEINSWRRKQSQRFSDFSNVSDHI